MLDRLKKQIGGRAVTEMSPKKKKTMINMFSTFSVPVKSAKKVTRTAKLGAFAQPTKSSMSKTLMSGFNQ